MEMQVETFEATEFGIEQPKKVKEEHNSLINELGLNGQMDIVAGDSVCPYRKMKADEKFAYENICPKKCEAKEYKDGPIPLRVLQVMSHANSLDFFDKFEIWYPDNADVKDPVLVGIVKKDSYDYDRYILARWGEVLEPLPKLIETAGHIAKNKAIAKYKKIKTQVEHNLKFLENSTIDEVISGEMNLDPSFYG